MSELTNKKVEEICSVLSNKKAEDIVAIPVGDKTIIAEWFIVCEGNTGTQVKAICDELEEKEKELGLELQRKEGYSEGRWIVLDYGDILVHIFHKEERKYYNIEYLWDTDQKSIRYS